MKAIVCNPKKGSSCTIEGCAHLRSGICNYPNEQKPDPDPKDSNIISTLGDSNDSYWDEF